MTASAWTDDRIGRLKTLWLEGQTAEQIAGDLAHGITRNAVLGKVHRLGLSSGRIPAPAPPKVATPRRRCEPAPVVQKARAPEAQPRRG